MSRKVYLKDIRNINFLPENPIAIADTVGGHPSVWGSIKSGKAAGGYYALVLQNIDRYGYEAIAEYDAKQRALRNGYNDDMEVSKKPDRLSRPIYLRKRNISAKFSG
jgi:hypothetical protein